ncbi:MAG: hypothetical protein QOK23_3506 [Gammaproteobacteria bacterium]|jgi:hypothetical protein|nr:hypothetical protein [Gammaproteobacteria bacterium]
MSQQSLKRNMIWEWGALALAAALIGSVSFADTPAAPSRHSMMKDCMAKQKASEAGRTKEDMKNSCRDATKTEKQNADKASKHDQQSKEPKS